MNELLNIDALRDKQVRTGARGQDRLRAGMPLQQARKQWLAVSNQARQPSTLPAHNAAHPAADTHLASQQEEDGQHGSVPGAVDEHGRQQVARPHVRKAQQEAQGGKLRYGLNWATVVSKGCGFALALPRLTKPVRGLACTCIAAKVAPGPRKAIGCTHKLPQASPSHPAVHTWGKSRGVRCTMPKATEESATAAGTGIHLVRLRGGSGWLRGRSGFVPGYAEGRHPASALPAGASPSPLCGQTNPCPPGQQEVRC